jgi:hypothetical protein
VGKVRENGMARTTDLSGVKFDEVQVIERAVEDICFKSKNAHWLCKCLVCGALFKAATYELTSGKKSFCDKSHRRR